MTKLNPVNPPTEFMGALGALVLVPVLPLITVVFYFLVNEFYLVEGVDLDLSKLKQLVAQTNFHDFFFNSVVWKYYLAWFFLLGVLDLVLPGKIMDGTVLRDGSTLSYKINGQSITAFMFTILTARYYQTEGSMPELQFIYANFHRLIGTTIVFSFILSTFLWVYSYIPLLHKNKVGTNERILAINGNSPNHLYNWFIGRELNPRIGPWDLKLYCETRPGMLLWFLINLSCLHHVYLQTGLLTDSLVLVNALQLFYIFDGITNEEGLLTMMDIATDGFGFMLVFGDLCWVPFTYSLQCRYLSLNPITLGSHTTVLILVLQILGFYIFRSANKQKSDFKSGKLQNLKSIKTKRGTNLLCDGWWGKSQHINYFGDWIIAWSWCLPTLFNTPLTYFYVIYFGVLLVHRQVRDEHKCREKYGDDWVTYTKQVPYKIIPYVY